MPISLLFGELVRFTAQPYLQVYSDRNCRSARTINVDRWRAATVAATDGRVEQEAAKARDGKT